MKHGEANHHPQCDPSGVNLEKKSRFGHLKGTSLNLSSFIELLKRTKGKSKSAHCLVINIYFMISSGY